MVMVIFFLPVKKGMSCFIRVAEGRGLPGNGDHLPEGRHHEKNEDESAAHCWSLPERVSTMGFRLGRRKGIIECTSP